jgi:outer membrane protein assembly factor BamB
MRNRPALAAAAALFAGGPLAAQAPCTGCPAGPAGAARPAAYPPPAGSSSLFAPPGSEAAATPTQEALGRLNLRSQWTAYVPMDGRADGLGTVQVVDQDQIFVQTKSGRLVALDGSTGAMQWSFHYPTGYAVLQPVGVTARLVFAVNVNTLYAFDRFAGAKEFEFDMPGLMAPGAGEPSSGPVADEKSVYVVLGTNKVVTYAIPSPITSAPPVPPTIGPDGRPLVGAAGGPTASQRIGDRYGARANLPVGGGLFELDPLETVGRAEAAGGIGLGPRQLTPSITAVARVTPPYRLARGVTTPSITSVASLRQPFSRYPSHLQSAQQSPSIAVTPTIAAVTRLSSLRSLALEPVTRWTARPPARVIYEPLQTADQLWLTTERPLAYGIGKEVGRSKGGLTLSSAPAAPMAGPVYRDGLTLAFVAEEDGTLAAIDLPNPNQLTPRVEWRANVGGFLNHKPVPAADGVYASGENAGIARVDLRTGYVNWRTEPSADHFLAVNDEFVYVMNHRGVLQVYPRRVAGTGDDHVRAVGRLDLRGFTLPVQNDVNDRVILGADSGLLVCLRDVSPKYARPVATPPPPPPPPPTPAPLNPPAEGAPTAGM